MDKEKSSCNQCGTPLWMSSKNGHKLGFCIEPECPNYGLFQMPIEDMPELSNKDLKPSNLDINVDKE